MLESWPAFPFCNFDVAVACRIQRVSVPAQRLRFFDRTLSKVAKRAGPIHGIMRTEIMTEIDRVLYSKRGILAHFGRFCCRTRGEDLVVERFGRHHRTSH